jgi:hypothetical protein
VSGEDRLPIVVRELPEHAVPQDAGVVYADVDTAGQIYRIGDDSLYVFCS